MRIVKAFSNVKCSKSADPSNCARATWLSTKYDDMLKPLAQLVDGASSAVNAMVVDVMPSCTGGCWQEMGAVTDGVWLAADTFFTWFALVAWLTTACFPMLLNENVLKQTEQRALCMSPTQHDSQWLYVAADAVKLTNSSRMICWKHINNCFMLCDVTSSAIIVKNSAYSTSLIRNLWVISRPTMSVSSFCIFEDSVACLLLKMCFKWGIMIGNQLQQSCEIPPTLFTVPYLCC